jgi:transposase
MAILTLWLIFARLIDQGSRLSAVRLASTHTVCEILDIDETFTEDTLYHTLDWCYENQEKIENDLFKIRYKNTTPSLYLYDVTSSYFEGKKNQLADYGYNRDGKKSKKQIVIGLLTDNEGYPVGVKVFKGNTNDTATVYSQIKVLKERFKVDKIILVGDRGMLKKPQQDALNQEDFNFITAITKVQIETLLKEKVIQLELFDNNLCEIEDGNIRYILRRNPIRCQEIRLNRQEKINRVLSLIEKQNQYLKEHKRAKVEMSQKKINNYLNDRKLSDFCIVETTDRYLSMKIDEEKKNETEKLDGCYVLKTDVKKEEINAEEIHARYKDLSQVEHAFRTFKTGYLETRPIFVRKKGRTCGHVFIVMLSYLISQYLVRKWKSLNITVAEGILELSSLCTQILKVGNSETNVIPEPNDICKKLLDCLEIKLPSSIEKKDIKIDTRKKLQKRRK